MSGFKESIFTMQLQGTVGELEYENGTMNVLCSSILPGNPEYGLD